MLTAEITINGEKIARITARNVKTISDKPGDFIGDRATICEYECHVGKYSLMPTDKDSQDFTITHDRRFGWEGLLNGITSKITPNIVETISLEE